MTNEELQEENSKLKLILEEAIKISGLNHYWITPDGEGFIECKKTQLRDKSECPNLFKYLKTNCPKYLVEAWKR